MGKWEKVKNQPVCGITKKGLKNPFSLVNCRNKRQQTKTSIQFLSTDKNCTQRMGLHGSEDEPMLGRATCARAKLSENGQNTARAITLYNVHYGQDASYGYLTVYRKVCKVRIFPGHDLGCSKRELGSQVSETSTKFTLTKSAERSKCRYARLVHSRLAPIPKGP